MDVKNEKHPVPPCVPPKKTRKMFVFNVVSVKTDGKYNSAHVW